MNKEFKKLLLDKLGEVLINQQFYVADLDSNYCVYHRRNDDYIEIIQWAEDKYKKYITVSTSIAFLDTIEEKSNINYKWFKEFNNGDLDKINVDDCITKYFLKGNFGERFYFTDVYLALGRGIVGIGQKEKKPLGIRLKKYSSSTYQDICDLIIRRLPRVLEWLRKQATTIRCQCPCCGYYTLNSRNMNDICPVCFWEDEDVEDPNEYNECNRVSLNEARQNYLKFGSCKKDMIRYVRRPRSYEKVEKHQMLTLSKFKNEFIKIYANDVPIDKLKKYVTSRGNYIWHLFSWELIDQSKYLTGVEAKEAYDKCNKENAIIYEECPEETFSKIDKRYMCSKDIERCGEIYVFAEDMSWVYINTHEESLDLGPYFICINNKGN